MQMISDKLADWFVKWKIELNGDESEATLIQGRWRCHPESNIIMDRHRIQRKEGVKYVGVIIDD